MSKFLVAIDGPAGSGKSSVSKEVARRLNFNYLDTGAAYRALAWAVHNLIEFDLSNLATEVVEPESFAKKFAYEISTDPDQTWVRVGAHDVTEAIRTTEVSESVSAVASIQEVRDFMKWLTHRIADQSNRLGIVIEGRDITTVVAPEAQVRLLLTASEEVRLRRRSKEIGASSEAHVVRQVLERDASDSKVVDFLNPAPGVSLVDSTNLDFEKTVQAVLALVEIKRGQ